MSRKQKLWTSAAFSILIASLMLFGWLSRSTAPTGSSFCAAAAGTTNHGKAALSANCAACHQQQQDRLQELVAKVRMLLTKARPAAGCPGAAQPAQIGSRTCAACHAARAAD